MFYVVSVFHGFVTAVLLNIKKSGHVAGYLKMPKGHFEMSIKMSRIVWNNVIYTLIHYNSTTFRDARGDTYFALVD